jgi:hypothetical protein
MSTVLSTEKVPPSFTIVVNCQDPFKRCFRFRHRKDILLRRTRRRPTRRTHRPRNSHIRRPTQVNPSLLLPPIDLKKKHPNTVYPQTRKTSRHTSPRRYIPSASKTSPTTRSARPSDGAYPAARNAESRSLVPSSRVRGYSSSTSLRRGWTVDRRMRSSLPVRSRNHSFFFLSFFFVVALR